MVQFEMRIEQGINEIKKDINRKYNIDMDKHDLLLVLNAGKLKRYLHQLFCIHFFAFWSYFTCFLQKIIFTNIFRYITDDDLRNSTIANGSTISIGTSVKRLANYCIKKICDKVDIDDNLKWLRGYADDIVFNREFCRQDGHRVLLNYLKTAETENEKAFTLSIVLSLIEDQVTSYCAIIGNILLR